MNPKLIKIILAVALLLCLLHLPYGYYELVRFLGMVGFGYLAFEAHRAKRDNEVIIYAGLSILFQPFLKIALGREVWNMVDVIVGIGLLLSVLKISKR